LSLANPDKRVLVITGDGNFLMGLGSSITTAHYHPKNLKILILDNFKYFTTGGQETVSSSLDYSTFLESLKIGYTGSKEAKKNQINKDLKDLLNSNEFGILHLIIEASKENLENIPWHPEEISKKVIEKIANP
jgi:sulfopyruvate decarboxylase subunit beta